MWAVAVSDPGKAHRESLAHRLLGICLLFAVVVWQLLISWPSFEPGNLNTGDGHIHISIASELLSLVRDQHRALGWNGLYGPGSPMFLLRPPGVYLAAVLTHALTTFPIEESLKLLVVLGWSLYPLSVFWGCRLLQLDRKTSLLAASLSPLGISAWGNTLDAYHTLGVYKQLLAILLFPPAVGSLWRLLASRRWGMMFGFIFPLVFVTHPYVAYCVALLVPAMLLAFASGRRWNWAAGLLAAAGCAIPAGLMIGWWTIPFFSSHEIQQSAPFFYARKDFSVVLCTLTETLRQLLVGGILDTSRWGGVFGGNDDWAWRDNGAHFRLPIVSIVCLLGLVMTVSRRRSRPHIFVALAFITAFALLTGPDDFPILDAIPFATKFLNVHSVFLFEWVAFMLGGIACRELLRWTWELPGRWAAPVTSSVLALALLAGWISAAVERTLMAQQSVDVKRIATLNGDFTTTPNSSRAWRHFQHLVDVINASKAAGAVSAVPSFDEVDAYNLLPHMVHRPLFVSAFEDIGGVYQLLFEERRRILLENHALQSLMGIRYVISRSGPQGDGPWPATMETVYSDPYWQLLQVKGAFDEVEALPATARFVGFVGSETEWAALMLRWLDAYRTDAANVQWIINIQDAAALDIERLLPSMSRLIVGEGTMPPSSMGSLPVDQLRQVMTAAPDALFGRLQGSSTDSPPSPKSDSSSDSPQIAPIRTEGSAWKATGATFSSSATSTPVLIKHAFYRSWLIQSDGKDILPLYRISPGLQLTLVPSGNHRLTWDYPGPNRGKGSSVALLAGIALLLLSLPLRRLSWFRKAFRTTQRWLLSRGRRLSFPMLGKMRPLLPALVCVIFLVRLGVGVVGEAILRIPVTVYPRPGETVPLAAKGSIDLHWNFVVGMPHERQSFTAEIAKDRNFLEPVKKVRVVGDHFRVPAQLTPGESYHYRVRFDGDGQHHTWSPPVRFSVARGGG
jgi:hypothetical protein